MVNFKVVVFDFDGTLVPSNIFKKELYYELLREKSSKEAIHKIVDSSYGSCSRKEIFSRISSNLSLDLDVENMLDMYNNEYKNYLLQVKPMEGFSMLFDYLQSSSIKSCINTANDEKEMKSLISSKNWQSYFELILGSPRTKVENLKKIMQVCSAKKEEICFIGDSEEDLQAALSINIAFFAFDSPDSSGISGNNTKISKLSELIANLK